MATSLAGKWESLDNGPKFRFLLGPEWFPTTYIPAEESFVVSVLMILQKPPSVRSCV